MRQHDSVSRELFQNCRLLRRSHSKKPIEKRPARLLGLRNLFLHRRIDLRRTRKSVQDYLSQPLSDKTEALQLRQNKLLFLAGLGLLGHAQTISYLRLRRIVSPPLVCPVSRMPRQRNNHSPRFRQSLSILQASRNIVHRNMAAPVVVDYRIDWHSLALYRPEPRTIQWAPDRLMRLARYQ